MVRGAALVFEVGTGKTRTIEAALALGGVKNWGGVILCPKSAIHNWPAEQRALFKAVAEVDPAKFDSDPAVAALQKRWLDWQNNRVYSWPVNQKLDPWEL